jgi:hypothetical protein
MPVQAVHVTSIEARRFSGAEEDNPDQVRIDHNSTVTLVQRIGDEATEIGFRYTASYGGLGVIKLEGSTRFTGEADAIERTWQADNEMPQDVASEVHTAVMQTCVPRAVGLARDLELPPPVPIPQINFEDGQAQADEGTGREVH